MSGNDNNANASPLPYLWSKEPLIRLATFTSQVADWIVVSIAGIKYLHGSPAMASELAAVITQSTHKPQIEVDDPDAVKALAMAKAEVEADFPLLYNSAVVSLWGALEASIEDLLVAYLLTFPQAWEEPQFSNVKVSLAKFHLLDAEERARLLLAELGVKLGVGQKKGVAGFEDQLNLIGASGPVPDSVSRALFEMQQMRNVIVHRLGIADRKVCSSCPWLGLTPGESIKVNDDLASKYISAVMDYGIIVLNRLTAPHGVPAMTLISEDQRASASPGSAEPP